MAEDRPVHGADRTTDHKWGVMRALRRMRQRARSLRRDERGATLIEFALLAVPFFALVGAMLETAIVFLASAVLDSGVQDTSRLIRTGQAQESGLDLAGFRSELCDNLLGLFDCSKLRIKVSLITDFASASTPLPVDEDDGEWMLEESYSAGVGKSIVLVQVYYQWPTLLNLAGFNLATLPNNNRLLGAATVFKNEPF